jgi:hypothetical protein
LNILFFQKFISERQFDVGLISPFGPRSARPKWRKIFPRAPRAERFCAPVEFTFLKKKSIQTAISDREEVF